MGYPREGRARYTVSGDCATSRGGMVVGVMLGRREEGGGAAEELREPREAPFVQYGNCCFVCVFLFLFFLDGGGGGGG